MRDIKILVVDDEVDLSNTIKEILEAEGYTVDTANTPEQAIDKVKTLEYLVVLTDIKMPGMTGVEMLKRIKEFNGIIQVIMMTGHSTMEYVVDCLEHGANDYLLKPFDDDREIVDSVNDTVKKIRKWERALIRKKGG